MGLLHKYWHWARRHLRGMTISGRGHYFRRIRLEFLEQRTALAGLFVVNSTADPGDGIPSAAELTLREAIVAANTTTNFGEPDRIEFNIGPDDPGHVYYRDDGLPGQVSVAKVTPTTAASDSGLADADPDWPHSWFSIKPLSNLPPIASGVIIDGYTQPGAMANTLPVGSDAVLRIELDGTIAGIPASGLDIVGDGNTIRGLAINRFSGDEYDEEDFCIEISSADNNTVEGNYLGTDVAGILDLGNAAGIYVWHSTNNRIGGTTPAARNVISGNDGGGIRFALEGNHLVQGNYIGTSAQGTAALGNGGSAVELINASSITIGGAAPGAGNVIAYNALSGVNVRAANLTATDNAILGNRIFSNGGLGIDLSPNDGVTPNDLGDSDSGANNRQNFPVLTLVLATATSTTVVGTLNSAPNKTFRIELFASAAADPAGFGEGQTFLGAIDVTTNTSGDAAFAPTLPVSVTGGHFITATATMLSGGSSNPNFGDSSEFARVVEVPLVTQDLDFGDAPNWFPTLLAQDGARHIIDPSFRLLLADAEIDGQPGLLADADDAAGSDDEDGVTLGTLLAGYEAEATVIATAAGVLNAWIDFDVDGGWSDPGEQIFMDEAVHVGLNHLHFAVPAWAQTPGTYARFRYSSAGGLSYTGLAPDGEVEDYLVPIVEPSAVSGLKFSDLNGDRDRDGNEPGLDGWVIYADLNDNGLRSGDEPAAVTHDGGIYTISGIPPGTYKIREVLRSSWVQTFPEVGYYELDFTPGSSVLGATFGNRPLMDFGDAGAYPTLFAHAGAAHIIDSDFHLGFRIDDEPDGQPSGVARGDDDNGIGDEDGVFFIEQLLAGNQAQVNVVASGVGRLDAWLDFNGDFDWDDDGEQIFNNRELADGFNALQIQVPEWVTSLQTFARFRFSSTGGLAPRGLADDGEVEDYLVTILRHEDFGDAPPEYASNLLAENGARHLIIDGFHLGAGPTAIDSETDGQPSASADGDDSAGDDDENGVIFPNPMRPGLPLRIAIVTSAAGLLDAWVDFNADGDWADFGEQVFVSEALFAGANIRNIQVPIGAALSDVFARFRFSSAGGLSYNGPATDGEVEDYAVPIDALGTIAGRVWHDRDADGQQATDEPGLPNWGVFLDDDNDGALDSNERLTATDAGGNYAFEGLAPGDYSVAALVEPGWHQGFPIWIPQWVYVAEQVWRPGTVFDPGHFVFNQVQIFNQVTLELIDTFTHSELDEGRIYDIEIGPAGDVYVAVDLGQGHGQIVQFTYEGDYLRTIDLPNDDSVLLTYPNGFDVLPDGSLLIPQPHLERLVWVNPDGSQDRTLDVPGFRPIDAAVQSDGTVVFTDNQADGSHDALLNVRTDDLFWVGTGEGAELRKRGGGVIWTRGNRSTREALETSDGVLFTIDSAIESPELFAGFVHRLVKYDAEGNDLGHAVLVGPVIHEGDVIPLPVDTEAHATGLAVALSEVPFGEQVFAFRAASAASETLIPVAGRPQNNGRGVWSVHVEPGQIVAGADFGNVQFSSVSGVKFNDQDQDGVRDPAEPGLDGWVIYADLDDDGQRDGREPFDTTHDGGLYSIRTILPGTFKLREEPQLPWVQSAPALGYYEVEAASGSARSGLDFGSFQPLQLTGEIRGTVWHDADTSTTRESGEPGLAGWPVFLDDDQDGQLDSNERSTLTDTGGNYIFDGLAPGNYNVAQVQRNGWDLIHPLDVPRWVYVAETHVLQQPRIGDPFYQNQIEIFDFSLNPLDSFTHDEFAEGQLWDVEGGPGGDVYVGVALGDGRGHILQFNYEGEFVRVIELPDDPQLDAELPAFYYPLGFDVLPDGSLLVGRPNSQQVVELNPDGSLDQTFDVPGFSPGDVGVLSDGFLVWTDANLNSDAGIPLERLLNVRFDDLVWVATPQGPELRDIAGEVSDLRIGYGTMEALETADGTLFASEVFGRLVRYTADGDRATVRNVDGYPGGLAVALNEVPSGEPVRGEAAVLGGNQLAFGAMLLAMEIPSPSPPRVIATGRGTWNVHVEAGQVAIGADFGVVQLCTASGQVFDDSDGDRTHDSSEPGLDGWVVYADLDDDGVQDGREPSAITAGGGLYTIEGIPPGTFKIREVVQPAWKQTAPSFGYLTVSFVPGSAIEGLNFGNQPCPADWLVRSGDTLHIVGDSQDNQVFVSVDHTGRLTLSAASDCFYEFTGIRRIVAAMDAGDDQLSLFGPVAEMLNPIVIEVKADEGDDQVVVENWHGAMAVDLGPGDDHANFRSAQGTPDPNGLSLNILGGPGNDTIDAVAAAFDAVDVQANLDDGDDRFALTLNPNPLPVNDSTSVVNVLVDAGSGVNDVVLDVQHTSLTDILESILIMGVGQVSLEGLFPMGLVNIRQAVRSTRLAAQPQFTLTSDGVNTAIDVRTGASDDVVEVQFDPAADGSVRFSADTGGGDDRVNLTGSRLFESIVSVDLGAGDDLLDLTGFASGVGPSHLELNVLAGPGDDAVNVSATSFFDVEFEVDLGAGDDQANVDIPPDPQTISGKVRELQGRILGGAGDDVTHSCIPMSLFDVLVDIDLGAGDDVALLEHEGRFPPTPLSQPHNLRANVAAGTGNDDVQILMRLLPPFPSAPGSEIPATAAVTPHVFDAFFDIDLGAGDDHFMFDVLPDSTGVAGKVRELHLTVHGGAGNDVVQDCDPATLFTDAFLEIDLGAGIDMAMLEQRAERAAMPSGEVVTLRAKIKAGAGNDEVQVLIGLLPPAPAATAVAVTPLGLLEAILEIDLGAGNDRFDGQVFVPPAAAGRASRLHVFGQQGADTMNLQLGQPVGGAPLFLAGLFDINLDGGAGSDTILCSNNLNIAQGARLSLRASGGSGNDSIDAFFQLVAESKGALLAQVLGGAGDDRLSLIARGPLSSPPAPLVLDGGPGFDRAKVTRNVKVKNCERTTTTH
jgi:hypothetical protein